MIALSKKGDLKRVLMILVVGLLLFGAFVSYFAFAETPEEEKVRLEAELAQLEGQLLAIEGGKWVNISTESDPCKVSFIRYFNYNCDGSIGYHIVKVLTPGIHNQRFNFSGQIAVAHNLASVANVTTNGSIYRFVDDTDTDFLNGNLTTDISTSRVVGTGGGANVTINISSAQNQTQNIFGRGITVNDSTVLYLKFEEGTGQYANDSSLYQINNGTLGANNGAASDDPVWNSTAKFGSFGLSFDGSNDFIIVSDSNTLDVTNMTLEAWIFRGSTGTRDMIITKTTTGNNGWQFEVDSTNVLSWSDSQSDCAGSLALLGGTTISANQWYHIAATRGSDDFRRIYVDGVQDGFASDTNGVCVNTIAVNIGARNNGGADSNPFHGTIDEVAIWNTSIDNVTILQHYQLGWGYFSNTTSNFTSQVFDANQSVQWSYIAWQTAGAYQTEIGRAYGDGFSIADDSLVDVVEGVVVDKNKIRGLVYSSIQNVSSSNTIINLPEKDSGGILSNRFSKATDSFEKIGGSTLNITMPEYLDGGNLSVSEKSLSNDNKTLLSSLAKAATLKSSSPFGDNLTSWPLPLKSLDSLNLKFSSAKNFISFNNGLDLALFSYPGSVFKGSFDMFPSDGRIIFQNLFYSFSSREHLENLPYHDSGAFEGKLATTDFTVSNDVFVDFDSHDANDDDVIFKGIGNQEKTIMPISEFQKICPTLDCNVIDYITTKKKIKDIKEGDYVLSLDESSGKLKPAKVNALLDHGVKPIFELKTEDDRAINTTAEHPYLVKLYDKELCDKLNGDVWNKNDDGFNGNYCTRWVEVRYLKEGMEIAVPRSEFSELWVKGFRTNGSQISEQTEVVSGSRVSELERQNKDGFGLERADLADFGVQFVKIKSIKTLEAQHVYDLSIEGTRNFVANNIIAHNTAAKESPFINTTGLVLLMHFNNETGESERQLNVTHNINNEVNLVLYMPFDSANARELTPNASTVLLMHFNNDTGTGENASLFLNNATYGNGTGLPNATCVLANDRCPIFNESNTRLGRAALQFDGVDDFLNISNASSSFAITGDMSVEFWFKPKDSTSSQLIADDPGNKNDFTQAFEFWWSDAATDTDACGSVVTNQAVFQMGGGGATNNWLCSGTTYSLNEWHHVAGTITGTTMRIYVDGALANSFTYTGTRQAPGEVVIGRAGNDGSTFNGSMDELAIWNISLSSAIIAKHVGYGIDMSMYKHNASLMLNSTANQTLCKFGQCWGFPGGLSRVNISNSTRLQFPRSHTAEAWFRRQSTSFPNSMAIVAQYALTSGDQQFFLGYDAGGSQRLSYYGGDAGCDGTVPSVHTGGVVFSDIDWHHIAGTYDASVPSLKIYVDGVDVSAVSEGGPLGTTGCASVISGVTIGASAYGNNFIGTIDEVAIWNISLSSDKIAEHAGAKVIDYSQYGNNGSRFKNTTSDFGRNFTAGKLEKGLLFDGLNDFVRLPNVTSLAITTNQVALEAWVYATTTTGNREIITKYGNNNPYLIRINSNNFLQAFVNPGTSTSATDSVSFPTNQWVHTAMSYDGSTLKLYKDGVQVASAAITGNLVSEPDPASIGAGSNGDGTFGREFFAGTIDEAAIWNQSLSADEIRRHYERGVLNLNLSYRTSNDNRTWTAWTGVSNNTLSATTANAIGRYFQYKVAFNTTNPAYTPILNNVSINYSLRSNLTIFDDSDFRVIFTGQLFNFTANFTDFVNPINGSNANCTLSYNATGWNAPIKMTYDTATKVYFYNTTITTAVNATFNVTCNATFLGYQLAKALDIFNISGETTFPIVNTTFNITSPLVNDVINFTGNITDNVALLSANITYNMSGVLTKINFTLSGTTAQVSNATKLTSGGVINFTMYATDTSNNVKQNSTLITVTDNVAPVVNTTFNTTSPNINDVINFTGNVTDETGLSTANITYNMSGILTKVNFTLSGTSAQVSNVTILSGGAGSVINFTMYATDTSNNVKQNSTLITVVDRTFPVVNTTFNKTSPVINDVINFTGNVTDETGLSTANITYNLSGILTKINFTLSGTTASIHNVTQITTARGSVINFTMFATDTSNNVKQNSTLITVANTLAPQATIVFPANNVYTNLQPLPLNVTFAADPDDDVINISYYINGKLNQTQFTNTTLNASDGYYILNVSLHDNVTPITYSANVTINFTIDTTQPGINFSATLSNKTFIDQTHITVNVTITEINFANITFYLYNGTGGIELYNETNFTSQTLTINFTNLDRREKWYLINVTARDKADNINSTETRNITLDNIAPRVNFTSPTPANNSRAIGNVRIINISIVDISVRSCVLEVNNGTISNGTNYTMEVRDKNCNVTILTRDGFNYTIKAYVNDSALHENYTDNLSFRENTAPVTPDLVNPANNSRLTVNTVTLNYTTNDTDGDSFNYIVYFDTNANPVTQVYRGSSRTFIVSTTDGTTYYWKVQADDSYENSSNSTIKQFTMNTPPPQQLILTPNLTGIKLKGSLRYNISWLNTSDAEGDNTSITLYYSTDSGITFPNIITSGRLNNGTFDWTVPSIDSNKARIKLVANDSFEFSEDISDNDFTIDSTSPVITLDNPANESSFNNGTYINLTITDNLAGLNNVSWNNNSYLNSPNRTDFNGTYDINTTSWQDGEVNISVFANDSAGNFVSAYYRFTVTGVQAVVTFNAPTPNQAIKGTFRVNVSSTSQLDDAPFVNFTFDGATSNSSMTQATDYYFFDFVTTTVSDGQRKLTVYGNNTAGTIVRADVFATIDNKVPAIRLDNPLNDTWKNSSVTFVYVPNDITTSIINCSLIINNTLNTTNSSISEAVENLFANAAMSDGVYIWDVNCTDTAGNIGSNGTFRMVKVDTVKPVITLRDPPNESSIQANYSINFTVTDSLSKVANVSWSSNYELDSFAFIGNYSINTSSFPEGATNITIRVNDSAGNIQKLLLTYTIDNTPPIITFNTPLPNQVVRGIFRVNVTSSDTLSNVSGLTFAFNGSKNFTMNRSGPEVVTNYIFDWNTTNATDRDYIIKIYGNDTALPQNIRFVSRFAIVDNTAPAIRLDSPANSTWSSATLNTFTFAVFELNNLFNCTLLINGSINSTSTSITKNTINTISVNLSDGNYRWTINCSDEAVDANGTRNVGTNATEYLINVDSTFPKMSFISPATEKNDTHFARNYTAINVTITEANFANITFYLYNQSTLINETNFTTINYSINFTKLQSDLYFYNVTIRDKASNENSTETRQISLNERAPSQNRFVITNASGSNIASIDDKGDMYLLSNRTQKLTSLSPTIGSFIIQNSSGDAIAYINASGYLFMQGTTTEDAGISVNGTNLEIRNSNDVVVAAIDVKGNLKLIGLLVETFSNP